MRAALSGILPALVTPFRENGAVDIQAFAFNLERYEGYPLAGYVVCGSTGEAAHLAAEEKSRLWQAARRLTERTLVAGTGALSTQETVALTERAADAGADAALVLMPHYYRGQMTVDILARHYLAVAERASIPILIYSVPAFTMFPFPPELVERIASHPRIAGIKESSGDLTLLARLLDGAGDDFTVLTGAAASLHGALALGAAGAILAVACCAPAASSALFAAFRRGDETQARLLQRKLAQVARTVIGPLGIAGLKSAMTATGWRAGHVRSPLVDVTDARQRETAVALLERAEALAQSSSS